MHVQGLLVTRSPCCSAYGEGRRHFYRDIFGLIYSIRYRRQVAMSIENGFRHENGAAPHRRVLPNRKAPFRLGVAPKFCIASHPFQSTGFGHFVLNGHTCGSNPSDCKQYS